MNLKQRVIHYIKHSFFIFGLLSIAWLIFRTGTKPSRVAYPCQQAAAATGYLWMLTYLAIPIAAFVSVRRWATPGKVAFMIGGILLVGSLLTTLYWINGNAGAESVGQPGAELGGAAVAASSDIFVVQGKTGYNGGFNDLLTLMRANGLEFYQSSDPNAPHKGLIGKNDVVIIKVNCQWPERGGTNTDLVKAVIEAILAHPEGFNGEIVVADNGQGRGSFTWSQANAENTSQSIQKVVNSFSGSHHVSTYLWDTIRTSQTGEYDQGYAVDGYILNTTPNPWTGLKVSYPKFRTIYGTNISFRKGIWENGTYNNSRLKLINMPVLKSHGSYEVTANLKHYVGVVSVSLGDPHASIDYGGMGTAMVETRYPDLNILDATWVNAIPKGYTGAGPGTPYSVATRADTIAASTDPVALDYYAAKHILMPRAVASGYSTSSMDPDNLASSSFGSWLRAAMQEIRRGGYQVTVDESQMNVYVTDAVPPRGVTTLQNTTYAAGHINWSWIDPTDSDFDRVMIYLDGMFKTNVSRGTRFYDATGLSPDTPYTLGTRTVDSNGNINTTWVNNTARTAPGGDTLPPAGVTQLRNTTYLPASVTWTWTDPADTDFSHVMVYLNGVFRANVTKGVRSFGATGLMANTAYSISTRTVDSSGNINTTWVNNTARTAPGGDTAPPASVTLLRNTTYLPASITWTWTDPANADFSHVMVYLNGVFRTNVTKGARSFTAPNLAPNTLYTIGTRTVDTSGNINPAWRNNTAKTAPLDTVPPRSVTNLRNWTYLPTTVIWTWTNPTNPDFSHVMVYLNGRFQTNTSKWVILFRASGLTPNTPYTIGTKTVDTSGNINPVWVNHTVKTAR